VSYFTDSQEFLPFFLAFLSQKGRFAPFFAKKTKNLRKILYENNQNKPRVQVVSVFI